MIKLNKPKLFKKSYSQQGEDLIIEFLLNHLQITSPFYFDIGSNHPIKFSNTYRMYLSGGKGVCIDPNLDYQKLYKKHRPQDQFLPIGVTGGESCKAAYYRMDWPEFNTFDRDQANSVQDKYQGRNNILKEVELPIENINDILSKYASKKIDLLNLDVEGFDLNILSNWNFEKYRPTIICVEIKDLKTGLRDEKIQELLENKGYQLVANNLINGIYIKT